MRVRKTCFSCRKNFSRSLIEAFHRMKFKKTYIEITNVCNLSCSFCPKTARQASFMGMDLYERILGEIKGHTKYIYFHVMGEPLLHPDLREFLDLARAYEQRVNITTNGTLIDNVADILLRSLALRQVNFSLHSFEANSSKSTIDEYLDKIFSFIRRSREVNLLVCLRLWNLQEEGGSENNRYILERVQEELKLPFKPEEQLSPCKGIKVGQNVFLNQALTFEWPDIQRSEVIGNRGFCYGLRDQIAFLVDGTVVPCCLDREGIISLGNIREKSFKEITESPRALHLFEGFSQRKAVEPLCQKCGYRQRFGT